jgi:hypothetical protein
VACGAETIPADVVEGLSPEKSTEIRRHLNPTYRPKIDTKGG